MMDVGGLDVKLALRLMRKSWGLTLVGGVAMHRADGFRFVTVNPDVEVIAVMQHLLGMAARQHRIILNVGESR